MKAKKVLSLVLGITITAGAAVSGVGSVLHADENKGSHSAEPQIAINCDLVEDGFIQDNEFVEDGFIQDNELVEDGFIQENDFSQEDYIKEMLVKNIISKAEADTLLEAEKKLDKLFGEYDKLFESEADVSKEMNKLDEKVSAIFDEIDPIYEKIDIESMYLEFKEAEVLNQAELDQYKKAEAELNALYDQYDGLDEKAAQELDKKIDAVFEKNKAIYDKIDMYFAELDKIAMEKYYGELVQSGALSEEDVQKLKAADAKAEELFASITEEMSDEEIEKIYDKVDALYDGIKIFDDCQTVGGDVNTILY